MKVQRAYHQRLRFDERQPEVASIPPGKEFSEGLRRKFNSMRENRVKQLASRIIEAALGLGHENHDKNRSRRGRRSERVLSDSLGERFLPCHAIVIENLSNYRPDEKQSRRENRGLLNWSATELKDYIEEGCKLHNIHLRDVMASYTSRSDFRTGQPGIRGVWLTPRAILGIDSSGAIHPHRLVMGSIRRLCRKENVNPTNWEDDVPKLLQGGSAMDRYVVRLFLKLQREWRSLGESSALRCTTKQYFCQKRGGPIFLAARAPDRDSVTAIDADLNAAANIALKAIMDPIGVEVGPMSWLTIRQSKSLRINTRAVPRLISSHSLRNQNRWGRRRRMI